MLSNPAIRGGPVIWPLREKLNHPVFIQQRPRWTSGCPVPELPTTPWNDSDRPPAMHVYYGTVDRPPMACSMLPPSSGLAALSVLATPLSSTGILQPPNPTRHLWQAKIPTVIHSLVTNSPLMPYINVNIPTLQALGGVSGGILIWPLRTKLPQARLMVIQQRPRYTGGSKIAPKPEYVWSFQNLLPEISYGVVAFPPPIPFKYCQQVRPDVVHALKPMPAVRWIISGITKDETGAPAAGFTVYLFNMDTGTPVLSQTTVSDVNGVYSFSVGQHGFWAVSYRKGTPDKAGATRNDLSGVPG